MCCLVAGPACPGRPRAAYVYAEVTRPLRVLETLELSERAFEYSGYCEAALVFNLCMHSCSQARACQVLLEVDATCDLPRRKAT